MEPQISADEALEEFNRQKQRVSPATSAVETRSPNPELRFEMSNGIGKLIEALAKARKLFTPIIKEETNPFFNSKYADLSAVIDATKGGLSEAQLSVVQLPAYKREAGLVEIVTLLAHSSGEWIKSTLEIPMAKQDAQGIGSAITYGRRYSYSAVLGVASESDDDANAAVSGEFKKPQKAIADHEKAFEEREAKQPKPEVIKVKAKTAEGYVVLDKISLAKTKGGVDYWKLEVTDHSGFNSVVACYDKKLWLPELWAGAGKDLRITVKSKDVAGKTYYDLVAIHAIGAMEIKPTEEEMPMFEGE